MYKGSNIKLICCGASFVAALMFVLGSWPAKTVNGSNRAIVATATPTPKRIRSVAAKPKYSEFSHSVKAHSVGCSSCHAFPSSNWKSVRAEDKGFPDITEYPKHASCVNCHKQQFFRGANPAICSICHTNPSPRNSKRHPFPNPREIFDESPKGKTADSDFQIHFTHDIHVEIVSKTTANLPAFVNASWSRGRRAEESCSVCHQTIMPQGDSSDEYLVKPPADIGEAFWLKKGTFKSSPIGHTTCFTCHSADSGMSPLPTDCAACHKLKESFPPGDFIDVNAEKMGASARLMRDAWRTRTSSGTFRHEWMSHAEMSCSSCHNVSAMVTTDQNTRKVAISSCNTCHITATSDDGGILNFEIDQRKKTPTFQCVKCHLSFGTGPIPESHLKAITAAAGN